MKTQQELMQAYWGPGCTVDMVKEYNVKHGCDVKPWECVKYEGNSSLWQGDHPRFDGQHYSYTFALTILYDDKRKEHRPVFLGDNVYHIDGNGDPWTVSNVAANAKPGAWGKWSWNPPTPKRTFTINDNELNCPINDVNGCRLDFLGVDYYFKSMHDRNKVASVISNILCAARDKE